jgi:gas vesicle protein GvpG
MRSAIDTLNRKSQSEIDSLNLQSSITKSAVAKRQSAMFIFDTMLIGGLRFVFDKIAAAVDTELNDDASLHEQLLAAQMRVEIGEMSQEEFDQIEADILSRLREIRDRRQGAGAATLSPRDYKITGIEASFEGDEHSRE